ncbi:hypothetical protein LTR53_019841, partial [Teratosphaeriaceae sp. CCFEE 6253]
MKLKKNVGKMVARGKPKHGEARLPTSKEERVVKELKQRVEGAEARVRATRGVVDERDFKGLEALERAAERKRLACGPFAENDALLKQFVLEQGRRSKGTPGDGPKIICSTPDTAALESNGQD